MSIRKLWNYAIKTKEEESVSIVKRREKRGMRVHLRTIEKRVY